MNNQRGGGGAAVIGWGAAAIKLLGIKPFLIILGIVILIPFLFLPLLLFFQPAAEVAYQVQSQTHMLSGPLPYIDEFNAASRKYDVDPALLAAIARQESGFNPRAVSPVGAQGVMQLMPGTAAEQGVKDPFDPAQNIMGGAKYLRQLLDMFNGDIELAVAAYNAGPGAVIRYGDIPPFGETKNYVPVVMGYYAEYQQYLTSVFFAGNGPLGLPVAGHDPGCGYGGKNGCGSYTDHIGLDFPAPIGTPIYAAADGVVKRVDTPKNNPSLGMNKSYGSFIDIDHGNGVTTRYAHMYPGTIIVEKGDKVERGQQIASVGNMGRSTGAHLHFEVRIEGKPVDPEEYLEFE